MNIPLLSKYDTVLPMLRTDAFIVCIINTLLRQKAFSYYIHVKFTNLVIGKTQSLTLHPAIMHLELLLIFLPERNANSTHKALAPII